MNSEKVPLLKDELLLLRPWIKEYAEDYLRINSKRSVVEPACIKLISELKEAKKKITAINKKNGIEWSIAMKENDDYVIIGDISICEVISLKQYKNVKEIGYYLDEKYWGRGIMPHAVRLVEDYCFNILGSEALVIRLFQENKRSQGVAEKCGYRYHSKKKIGDTYKVNYIKIRE